MSLFIDLEASLKDPIGADEFDSSMFDLDYSEIETGYRYKKVIKKADETNYIEIGIVDKNKKNPKVEHRQRYKEGKVSVLVTYKNPGSLKIKEITYSITKYKDQNQRSQKISILEDGSIREYSAFGRHKIVKIYDSSYNLLEVKLWDTGKKGDEFDELFKRNF